MRIQWTERRARPGWDVTYTVIGGRLWRDRDRLDEVPENLRESCRRALSQTFIAATPRTTKSPPDVAYWAAVTNKVIQRGEHPYIAVLQAYIAPLEAYIWMM